MSVGGDVTLFTDVDHTQDPGFFARFLDRGNAIPGIVTSKPVILDGLRLQPGQSVLEAGCGMGADAADLARIVGPSGRVVGVDVSEVMIAEARRRWADSGLPVEFHVGDALALAFGGGTFDACRSERMLMHVPDAERALAEMARVVRPGGRLSVFDFDWDSFVIDSPDRDTTRTVVRWFADGIRNGWIGRRLARMFKEAGLDDVTVRCRQIFVDYEFLGLLTGGRLSQAQREGVLAPDVLRTWWDDLRRGDEAGTFLAGFTAFIVAGTKA